VPLADRLRAMTQERALLIVNGRLDVAQVCGADGVHLPERGPSVAAARRLAGDGLIIGRSVHCAEEAVKAQDEGADYVQVGAIFPTRSHPGPPAGLALLEGVAARVAIPVLAVGGISAANVGQVMQAGASGAAVISAVLASPSPAAAARRLAEAMLEAAVVGRRARS
jgi:thiamine-phosphate diphosphorylase